LKAKTKQKKESKTEDDLFAWSLSDEEVAFLKSYLKPGQVVLEWGAGKTTLELSKLVKKYYSVEHDFYWYNQILKRKNKNVRLYFVAPNTPDRKYLRFSEKDDGSYSDFKNYVDFIENLSIYENKFDIVIVDGRARVDCVLKILPYISEETLVFLHNFDRYFYWKVLDYYNIEKIVDKLVLLKKKTEKNSSVLFEVDRGFLIKKFLIEGFRKKLKKDLRPRSPEKVKVKSKKDLAVVCCYFNPLHHKSRLKNYEIFRRGIELADVELLTVELAIGNDPYELSSFSNVIQLRCRDVLWHKENLLNIGIKELISRGYKKIAWLDADIIFDGVDWVDELSEKLDKYMVCQVFEKANRDFSSSQKGKIYESAAKYALKFQEINLSGYSSGFGWAARSELLEKINLYDAAIIGGGDLLILFACFFNNENIRKQIMKMDFLRDFGPLFLKNYFEWAKKWADLVQGNVGYADSFIRALYHGEIKKRYYVSRYLPLSKHKFDPCSDIKKDSNSCWEWATNKRKLHKKIKDYFISRKEDE
jgi:hypothetical protein